MTTLEPVTLTPSSKSLSQLSREDREALLTVLEWENTPLKDCSKKQLLECIVYMTAQTVMLKSKLDYAQTPWYVRVRKWIADQFKPRVTMAIGTSTQREGESL